jgi:potassium efflux system protein
VTATRLSSALAVLMLLAQILAGAQTPPPRPASPASPPAASQTAPSPAAPQPIPVPDIAARAEDALGEIRQLENRLRVEDVMDAAAAAIPPLERETAYRQREMRQLKNLNPSLETVQEVEQELHDIELRVAPIMRELTRAALQLDRDLKELERIGATWNATIEAAVAAAAPEEVLGRAKDLNRALTQAKKSVLDSRAKVLALQGQATDIGTKLTEMRSLLAIVSERAVTRLLYRDSPPLWGGAFWESSIGSFSGEASDNLQNQLYAINDYLRAHAREFVFHLLFFLALAVTMSAVRARISGAAGGNPEGPRPRQIFDMPMVSAMLFAMLLSGWFYPSPPRALMVLIGVLAAGPLLVFARRLVDARIYPLLYALVIFYLLDRVRILFAPLPGLHRVALLLEVLSLILFFVAWLRRKQDMLDPAQQQGFAWHVIGVGIRSALLLAIVVLASCMGGYMRFADLLMRSLLASVYAAVVLYTLTREGVVQGLLQMPPISFLAGVRRHRAHIAMRINRWLTWVAFLFWFVWTLRAPGFLQQAADLAQAGWKLSWSLGSLTLAVSDISLFIFILWSTYVISRLSRFLLEEEIFSRVRLDRGLPYAVSTSVHYVILVSGLVLAATAVGLDTTKFTIVAGALTVGVGFGLQNIVNNFVSGLIVLFERPVKVGDTIQIDDVIGRVQHIGIRATIVHSTSGAQVIIPNGKLISDRVTNWTLTSQLRQIAVPVITKPDINVGQLKSVLLDIARANGQVLETPAPEVLFIKRGVDQFEFELRVWTGDLDAWLQVRSDLITAINDALEHRELPAQAPDVAQPEQNPGPS